MKHMNLLIAATVTAAAWLATPAWADPFFFSTGTADAKLAALSQPADSEKLETETAPHVQYDIFTDRRDRPARRDARAGELSRQERVGSGPPVWGR